MNLRQQFARLICRMRGYHRTYAESFERFPPQGWPDKAIAIRECRCGEKAPKTTPFDPFKAGEYRRVSPNKWKSARGVAGTEKEK